MPTAKPIHTEQLDDRMGLMHQIRAHEALDAGEAKHEQQAERLTLTPRDLPAGCTLDPAVACSLRFLGRYRARLQRTGLPCPIR